MLPSKMKRSTVDTGNSGSNPPKWRRIYKACISCRNKKMKCDMGPLDNPHGPPCMRCRRENKECVLPNNKKRGNTGRGPKLSKIENGLVGGAIKRGVGCSQPSSTRFSPHNNNKGNDLDIVDPKWKFEVGTMYNALEFLAKAAGSVSKGEPMEMKSPQNRDDFSVRNTPETAMNDNIGNLDTSDESFLAPLMRPNGAQRAAAPLIEKLSSMRPKSSKKLTDVDYIGPSKLLSEDEAIRLIDIFFLTMHPFFPHIPLQLQDPHELVRYPILLCAILTISARYNSFDELGFYDGEAHNRNIEVHERLWIYCQRLISQTIWAEASTRSIGTVLAFLLFTEWNPRAIHWKWSDYANYPGLNDVSKRESNSANTPREIETFTGMAVVRRSDRMAWMLIGAAVRLAQDMSFIDTSSKIFVATHIAEAHTAMNLNQKSILSESLSEANGEILEQLDDIGNENFYLEHILQEDESKERWTNFLQNVSEDRRAKGTGPLTDIEREFLNDEYVLYYVNARNDVSSKSSFTLPFPLKFSRSQRAKIELLRILTIGYESIYYDSGKSRTQLLNGDPKRNIALLEIISTLIEKWHATHKDLLIPASARPCSLDMARNKRAVHELAQQIDRESLSCDYNYCQLYIYSLALQNDVKSMGLKMPEIRKSARYVELAYTAAKGILDSAERIHSLKMLRYMPVRWVTRIVRAVAFLVKCYLVLTREGMAANPIAGAILRLTVISSEEAVPIIERAAVTLQEAAPDEVHLGMRYSRILMYLCAEVKRRTQMSEHDEEAEQERLQRQQLDLYHWQLREQRQEQQEQQEQQQQQQKQVQEAQHVLSQNNSPASPSVMLNSSMDPTVSAGPYNQSVPSADLPFEDPFDWFATSGEIGLDFVDTWTEMIENRYMQDELGNVDSSQGEN
ncbi:hypothetical protein ZYGR_0AK05360 [Zygosaccharomyces rouxii]|uniref:Zn(2)-C6 fungal-type domain-containing protein n=1 Tax=Zygosaccharomyces rouxii TaxID=4956 RepID=A0A1Q3AE57_ZYGRO|nr:hypothetical protein ZYGR_0AK05360 [Zygosaccharomyces rouxii]